MDQASAKKKNQTQRIGYQRNENFDPDRAINSSTGESVNLYQTRLLPQMPDLQVINFGQTKVSRSIVPNEAVRGWVEGEIISPESLKKSGRSGIDEGSLLNVPRCGEISGVKVGVSMCWVSFTHKSTVEQSEEYEFNITKVVSKESKGDSPAHRSQHSVPQRRFYDPKARQLNSTSDPWY